MSFAKFEAWIKRNKVAFFLLIPLFVAGILFQAYDVSDRIKDYFNPPSYQIVDINFDRTNVTAEEISEGQAMGRSLFHLRLNGMGTNDLLNIITFSEVNQFLFRIRGTTPIDDHWVLGDEFSVGLIGDDCSIDKKGGEAQLISGRCQGVYIHFIPSSVSNGWNSFVESPDTCCENYFTLKGFYRLERFRDKGDGGNQYFARPIEPDAEKAEASFKKLKAGEHMNRYIEKESEAI